MIIATHLATLLLWVILLLEKFEKACSSSVAYLEFHFGGGFEGMLPR